MTKIQEKKKAKTIERESHVTQTLRFSDSHFKITMIDMVMEIDKNAENFTKNWSLFKKY